MSVMVTLQGVENKAICQEETPLGHSLLTGSGIIIEKRCGFVTTETKKPETFLRLSQLLLWIV